MCLIFKSSHTWFLYITFMVFFSRSFKNTVLKEREENTPDIWYSRASFTYHRAWRVWSPNKINSVIVCDARKLNLPSVGKENRLRGSRPPESWLSWRASDQNCAGGRPENGTAPSRIIYLENASYRVFEASSLGRSWRKK